MLYNKHLMSDDKALGIEYVLRTVRMVTDETVYYCENYHSHY